MEILAAVLADAGKIVPNGLGASSIRRQQGGNLRRLSPSFELTSPGLPGPLSPPLHNRRQKEHGFVKCHPKPVKKRARVLPLKPGSEQFHRFSASDLEPISRTKVILRNTRMKRLFKP